jgi:hypothetical protein
MSSLSYLPEVLRRFLLEKLIPTCKPMRGAFLLYDSSSPWQQFLICGTNPGTVDAGPYDSGFSELAFIRAELPNFGMQEVMSAELIEEGFFIIVGKNEPILKFEDLAEGCWTYSKESEVELGRLLKGLSDLAWRAWEARAAQAIQPITEESEEVLASS